MRFEKTTKSGLPLCVEIPDRNTVTQEQVTEIGNELKLLLQMIVLCDSPAANQQATNEVPQKWS